MGGQRGEPDNISQPVDPGGVGGLFLMIQVAKQVRTVPVRGFGAEERFDAEECDLENYASPPSPPQFFEKSHMLEKEFKTQATNLRE